MNRWEAFTEEEREVLNQALIDSRSRHSDYGWYLRCCKLHKDLVDSQHPSKSLGELGQPTIVYLLTIEHRHGIDHWVCATDEIARASLDNYVRTWWDDEMDETCPATPEERIRQYFAYMGERDKPEFYNLQELEVLGQPIDDMGASPTHAERPA